MGKGMKGQELEYSFLFQILCLIGASWRWALEDHHDDAGLFVDEE